jgi:signal transduction histidine kinase
VDDEAAQMTALCQTLDEEGYSTTGFTSAKEALAALHDQQFDLVLSDLMMPEVDGIALLRAAHEIDGNLVAIVMTGHGTIDTAVEAMKAGALDYILKPFKLSAILPVLSRALAVRRLRKENRDLQDRVRERTMDLEAANKELEAFSYSVSHDLRAPLRHILGFAGMLETKAASILDGKNLHYLNSISESATQMGRLIDDLLTFSRMGRAEMQRTQCNMNELVDEVLREMSCDTQGRNIDWKLDPLPEVSVDRALLKQVWVNLLSNAVKYTRDRNPAEVKVGWKKRDQEHEFYVKDNGAGFDMEYADKLFGVFQRLHSAKEFEGTGIGLANVRRIISRHGGQTWAEGKPGAGATFYFSLPQSRKSLLP